MLRPAWLLSLSLVFTSASGAADLGPLRVLSASGDPLRAEIEISAYTPEEASTLQVNLASAEIYREAKLAYPEGLSGLSLRVADRPNGRKVVEVVSAGPVDAHVLDLLVEVTWNLGRYIRQYSFVLKSPPAEARAPVVAGAAVPPTLVRPGDTLFDLATRLRPEGATVFQTLLALFHANPQSFIDGNMNLLRAGSSLQVPLPAQVMAESDNQARQTLRTQNESFALYRERVAQAAAVATPIEAAAPANTGAGSIAAAPAEPTPVENTGDALKLSAQGTAATDASNPQAVRDRLEEEKAATQRAIDESESRVKELQSNITAMRGLLESQNQALSGMEQRANADAAAAAAGAGGAAVDPAATPADPAAAAAAGAATDPAADPATTDTAAADAPAADAAADPAASTLNEDTPTPTWANEKVIALFGGVLALLAVGLAVITLRRRARPNTRFDANESAREPGMAPLPVMPADSAMPASSAAAVAAGGAAAPAATTATASAAAAAAAAAAAYVASTSDEDEDEYGPLEDDGDLPEHVAPIAPIAFGFDLDLDKPADAFALDASGSFAREPLAVLPLADMVYAPSPEATNDAAGFHVMPLHADLSANAQAAEGGYGPAVQRAAATAPVPDGATRDDLAEGFAKAAVLPAAAVDAEAATPVAAPVSASVPESADDGMSVKSGATAFDDAAMDASPVASVTADAAAASPEPAAAAPVMVQPQAESESKSARVSSTSAASGSASAAAESTTSAPEASVSDPEASASTSSTPSAPATASAASAAPVSVPAAAPVAKAAADLQAALAMTAGAASAAALAASAASANAGSRAAGSSAAPAVSPAVASTAASPVAASLSSVTTPAVSPVIPAGDAPLEPPITPDTVSPGAPVMPVVTPPATPGLLPEPTPMAEPTPAPVTAPTPASAPIPAAKTAPAATPSSTRVPGASAAAATPAKPVPASPKTVLSFDTGSSTGAPTASKFDLAKAYIDLGDRTAARELLNDIVKTGDTSQKHRARDMLATL